METESPDGKKSETVIFQKSAPEGFGDKPEGLNLSINHSRGLVPVYKEGSPNHDGFRQEGPETFTLTLKDWSRDRQVLP